MIESENIRVTKALGEKIREFRLNKNISQELLAFEASIPRNQIGRIERGEINTSILTLTKICKALEIEIRELF